MEPVDTPDAKCAACGWDNHDRENKDTALEQTILKGQYIVGKSLGRGGFGITYVGFDTALERRIAIKEYFPIGTAYRFSDGITIRAYSEAEEDYQSGLDQALQESRTIAKLGQIPNVMQVYNVFIENGTVYMIMEYIDGVSLGEEVKRNGKLNWKEALHLMYPIMDALEKIHEQGLIHRDISPENIIRRKKTGEPVLLDFGSARQPKEGLTVMLKPGYAPAEQYSRSGEQDGRVDEYALCATMYYLVTGSAPASADLRLFAKKELKRPSEYADDISAEIEEVLLKGMELNSSDRYMSVKELHQAFLKAEQEAGKAGSSVKPSPPQPPKPEREAGKAGSSVKPSPSQPPKPENREKNGLLKRVAGIAIAAAVGCLGGFLLFGNAGHDRNTKKEATVSSVQENAEETKGDEAVEAEKNEPTPAPESTATNTPVPQPTATNTPTPQPTATNTPTPHPTETPAPAGPPRMKSYSNVDFESEFSPTVLGSEILRSEITEIRIVKKSLKNAPAITWDVSEAGDGSVLARVTRSSKGTTLTIAGEGGVSAPKDSSKLFAYYYNLRNADLSGLDTSNVTDMNSMFCLDANSWLHEGKGLTSLDLSSFDTHNVTDMHSMFSGCQGLTSLDLASFDTQNVTDMHSMFSGCQGLTSLDLASFDTHNVTTMQAMFLKCQGLTSLDLTSFDTQNVTTMAKMFYECQSLTSLDLTSFDTQNVTNMDSVFYGCRSLTSLDLTSFDTHNVTTMQAMFNECSSLTSLDLSSFDTQNVTNMRYMFAHCGSLPSIDISSFDTSKAFTGDYGG